MVLGTQQQQSYTKRLKKDALSNRNRRHQKMTDYLAYELKAEALGVSVLSDQSIFIKNSIDEVKSSAVYGGIFAVIVLFIFLRDIKSTIIIK